MSAGDVGPYVELDGNGVWVPRTVSYLRARRIAKEAIQDPWLRLVYRGKVDATLYGFTRDCWCEDRCSDAYNENDEPTGWEPCLVPAWAFTIEERE